LSYRLQRVPDNADNGASWAAIVKRSLNERPVILLSWISITIATNYWFYMSDTALALMGIGVGTAFGAVAATPPAVADKVKAYKDALAAQAITNPGDAAAMKAAGDLVAVTTKALQTDTNIASGGFVNDLLSDYGDDTGPHGLQSVLFTLAIGAVFFLESFRDGAMPTLSATLLALMGISGSAYVGFKMAAR